MKIIFVTQPWDGIGLGSSIGIVTCNLIKQFKQTKDIYIFCKGGTVPEEYHSFTLKYIYVSLFTDNILQKFSLFLRKSGIISSKKKPIYISSMNYFFYALKAAIFIRFNNINIVHIHNYSQIVSVIRFLNPETKIILHMHCEWLSLNKSKTIKKRIKDTDIVFGCSKYISDKIAENYPEFKYKINTLYNGFDPDKFNTADTNINDTKISLLYLGRISPEKGLHVLLPAFNKISKLYDDVVLWIAGSIKSMPKAYFFDVSDDENILNLEKYYKSNYYEQLVALIDKEAEKKINFCGFQDSYSMLNKSDILILPSVWNEPFGMPVIEAMAAGKIVIASKSGGITELISENINGFLFEKNDIIELSNRMDYVIRNLHSLDNIRQNAINFAYGNFTWEIIASKLENIYNTLCGEV